MQIAEWDRRARTYDGWLRPWFVEPLIEQGRRDVVRRLADGGDWYCVAALARESAASGDAATASKLLDPFVRLGWWEAVKVAAESLTQCGHVDEALDLCHRFVDPEDQGAIAFVAGLAAGAGRGEAAFALLRDQVDRYSVSPLVQVTEGLGRDEEVLALIDAAVAAQDRNCECGPRRRGISGLW